MQDQGSDSLSEEHSTYCTMKHYKGFVLYKLSEVRIVIACIVNIKQIPELYICIYDKADLWCNVHAFELNIRAAHTLYLDIWNLVCCEINVWFKIYCISLIMSNSLQGSGNYVYHLP